MGIGRSVLTAALLMTLVACGKPGNQAAGLPDGGRLEKQAQEALTRWDAAVAASGGAAAFVPVGDLTGQIGDWEEPVGGNNKLALMTGNVVDKAGLSEVSPQPRLIQWVDGKSREVPVSSAAQALRTMQAGKQDCQGCRPLEVTDARLSTKEIATSRGKATVPAWEFTVLATRVVVTRVAVDPSAGITVTPPSWDPNNAPGGLAIESATASADGRRLTVGFTGSPGAGDKPCGIDYSAVAVESASAVVIVVHSKPHAQNEICTMIGARRTAVATLATPLGDRAVLEVMQGLPVPVTIDAGK